MTTLNPRLQLALLNRKRKSSSGNKGFTLVELMIVIVIVGILAAIALPNFLNQTKKAKSTEAKSDQSAIMKNASAEFQQGGSAYVGELLGATNPTSADFDASGNCTQFGGKTDAETKKWNYRCEVGPIADNDALFSSTDVYVGATTADPDQAKFIVTAIADGTDSSLGSEVVTFVINLNNGHTEIVEAGTCKSYGGTATGTVTTTNIAAGTYVNDSGTTITATCP